jgi:hypothetical protein
VNFCFEKDLVMKRIKSILIIIALVLIPGIMSFAQSTPPEPPHPGDDPSNTGGIPVGGTPSAPIGNGGTILIFLAMAYGLSKYTGKNGSENELPNG